MNEQARMVLFSATTANKAADLFPQENTDQWATPPALFAALDAEFGFHIDVCALPHSAKCETYFTPEVNGLAQPWEGVCWCNPPYGREIGDWVEKAWREARLECRATTVMLLPVRTDTAWWHDYVWDSEETDDWRAGVRGRFLRGRVKFGGAKTGAPFPSVVVVFEKREKERWER